MRVRCRTRDMRPRLADAGALFVRAVKGLSRHQRAARRMVPQGGLDKGALRARAKLLGDTRLVVREHPPSAWFHPVYGDAAEDGGHAGERRPLPQRRLQDAVGAAHRQERPQGEAIGRHEGPLAGDAARRNELREVVCRRSVVGKDEPPGGTRPAMAVLLPLLPPLIESRIQSVHDGRDRFPCAACELVACAVVDGV